MSPQTSTPPDSEPDPSADDVNVVRLQKFLASTGLGSRRHCEDYIETGRVTVDGEVITELGAKVNPETQVINVDGERVRLQARRYYLLNKPSGFLCTNNDPSGRRRVVDLFPEEGQRLFTVGRLDENSEGLILVTNDGALAQRLAHPRYKVARTYHVQVAGNPTREKLEELRKGIRFKEGVFRVSGLKPLRKQGKSTFLELTLHEGQNREIRRMMARIGHKVIQLIRVRFGPLNLGKLKSGEYKRLTDWELKKLREMMDETPASEETPRKGRKSTAYGKGRPASGAAMKRKTPGRKPAEDKTTAGEGDSRPKRARTTSGGSGTRSKKVGATSGGSGARSKKVGATSGGSSTRSKKAGATSGGSSTRSKKAGSTSGGSGTRSKKPKMTAGESSSRPKSGDTKSKKSSTKRGAVVSQQAASGRRMIGDDQQKSTRQGKRK
tara:strand:- start:1273 stop:2586 length:1314 start_codon:yes stop_codon:yes gene_type:complete